MKVLFVSNLFPDTGEPLRGAVNARLLQALARLCEIRVVSPRPELPLMGSGAGGQSRTGLAEDACFKPVYPVARYVPKVGSRFNHGLMERALRPVLETVRKEFAFEVILAAWVYPDGCAVAKLAEAMGVPCVWIAQGSDVHEYLLMAVRRRVIVECATKVTAVIARSKELARLLESAPVARDKLHVIYNGVDAMRFKPGDKAAARTKLGWHPAEKTILFVGGFFPVKNPQLALESFALWRQRTGHGKLIMIGTGPLWEEVRNSADKEAVSLVGQQGPDMVALYMQAADVLCVPSDNEGVPNVIYEAWACGLPVVATRVGGIPEVMTEPFLGRLVEKRDREAMAAVLEDILSGTSDPHAIAGYAQTFSWERTAAAYQQVLDDAAQLQSRPRDEKPTEK